MSEDDKQILKAFSDRRPLRDWFAGQALVGLCSIVGGTPKEHAEYAYALADAMLAEREKSK